MLTLQSLWLVVLASAGAVFVASCVVCMALPIHKKDYRKLGDKEDGLRGLVRGMAPGVYMFPFCTPKEERTDPAAAQRVREGPWGILSVQPRGWSMGPMLGLWFLHMVIVSFFVAYITRASQHAGAHYLDVFRVAGAAALLGHGAGALPSCIWNGRPWSQLPGQLFDAVVYALITAGMFGWLWPKVA